MLPRLATIAAFATKVIVRQRRKAPQPTVKILTADTKWVKWNIIHTYFPIIGTCHHCCKICLFPFFEKDDEWISWSVPYAARSSVSYLLLPASFPCRQLHNPVPVPHLFAVSYLALLSLPSPPFLAKQPNCNLFTLSHTTVNIAIFFHFRPPLLPNTESWFVAGWLMQRRWVSFSLRTIYGFFQGLIIDL